MRGVVVLGDRQAKVVEFPDPNPGEGEVVVAMRAAAVCGSDLHGYRASTAERAANADTIPGHEPAGVVAAVGEGVRRVKVGDRVSIYHFRACGHCRRCRGGQMMWCAERRGYGGPIHGSDADYLLTDERNCLPLPDDLSFEVGALIACNTGTAFSSMKKLAPSAGDTLAVFGLGPVGLNGLLIAKAMGARVVGVDVSAYRRNLALELGAEIVLDPSSVNVPQELHRLTDGAGADLAFETSGNTKAQAQVPDALGFGGKAVFVGFGAREPSINPSAIIGKQLVLMGSFVASVNDYWDIVDFIRGQQLPLEKMITHRFPLSEASEAFRLADSGMTGKVMFVWP